MITSYALLNCRLIDVRGGDQPRAETTILVREEPGRGGRIEYVGGPRDIPRGYAALDLRGAYVMPGLINAHVHLFGSGKPMKALGGGGARRRVAAFLKTGLGRRVLGSMVKRHAADALLSGATTLRCVGDIGYSDVALRDAIDAGRVPGPRLLVSGPGLCVTGGHGSDGGLGLECDSPWEARRQVRRNVREGVDLIKLGVTGGVVDARRVGEAGRLQMTVEEVQAACDEAHKVGLRVAAHVESTEGIRVALRGGVDTIEHGAPLDGELIGLFKSNPRSLNGYSSLTVTISPALPLYLLDPDATKLAPVAQANAGLVYEGIVKGARQALEAGMSMGLGTDASCPFVTQYDTWRELRYAVELLGMSPAQAIRAATLENARILGIDGETGSLEEGKSADMLIAEGDPLADLRNLSRPTRVIARGRIVDRPSPRRMPRIDEALDALAYRGDKLD